VYSRTDFHNTLPTRLGTTKTMMPKTKDARDHDRRRNRSFKLLLGAELVGVSALALSAVGRTRWETSLRHRQSAKLSFQELPRWRGKKTYIALAANHLVAVEFAGKSLERRLDDTTAEAEDEVESRLLHTHVLAAGIAKLSQYPLESVALIPVFTVHYP
jgi:hypothetical protein